MRSSGTPGRLPSAFPSGASMPMALSWMKCGSVAANDASMTPWRMKTRRL